MVIIGCSVFLSWLLLVIAVQCLLLRVIACMGDIMMSFAFLVTLSNSTLGWSNLCMKCHEI